MILGKGVAKEERVQFCSHPERGLNVFRASLANNQRLTLVTMFDLLAPFDTIDHGIMLQRLYERFDVQGDVLKWIQCYISDREQYVCIDGSSSERSPLSYGVPQGYVLGSFLFCTYLSLPSMES